MNIHKEQDLFYVNGKDISLIIEQRDGDLFLKHLGKRINHYHFSNRLYERDHAFSGNPTADDRTFSYDTQRQLIGVYGFGDFRQPSLKIQHENNELTQFKFKAYHIHKGLSFSKGLPNPHSQGSETLELILEDEIARLRLTLYYSIYPDHSTISTFSRLENLSTEDVIIHRDLSTMADLPGKAYDLITFQGAYAREKKVRRQKVEQGIFTVSSNRGASGHGHTPSLILADHGANEQSGEVLAFQLLYSGNFQAFVQRNQLDELRVGIGIHDENFSWCLKPGESFDTPVALITYSDQGLTGLTHESQDFVWNHIMPETFAKKERPILINNWEATYFNFTKDKLLELADEAKALGIELFVLDDGWFSNRSSDDRALGDWKVNEEKLDGSLADFIEAIHDRKLKFGLWVEPEMVSENSDLYRKHPEWAIQTKGRAPIYSRSQLVLNLANPDVVSYLKETFDQLLTENKIDYIKWDYNRNITSIGNGRDYLETQMQSHQYMLGLYDLVSYLTTRHPDVLFESCSGGGGRNDLGMMCYFPQVWASDNTDAISRLSIQYGSSYLYPTISMGAHVSASPNHQMGRFTPLKTRGDVAMMGNFGYELDLTILSKEEKEAIQKQVSRYKALRPIVQFGKQYRLINPEEGSNEAAVQFVYQDKTILTYVRIQSTIEKIETTVKLKGLDPKAYYQLQDNGEIYSGEELMYAGLTMPMPSGDYLSQQLYFIQV